jgi:Superinfection immunity protein
MFKKIIAIWIVVLIGILLLAAMPAHRDAVIVLLFVLPLYFMPTLIAAIRQHCSLLAIFVLNLLLGWTVISWLIALVWACTGYVRTNYVREIHMRDTEARVRF